MNPDMARLVPEGTDTGAPTPVIKNTDGGMAEDFFNWSFEKEASVGHRGQEWNNDHDDHCGI